MKRSMKLASRGKRFAAGLIDMALPLIAYFVLVSIYGISIFSPGSPYGYNDPFGYGYGYNYNYDIPLNRGSAAGMVVLFILLVVYVVVEFVLFARASSIGKAIMGLQVVSSIDGKPFGFWKMVLRECIVKSASSGVFFLGYIWILLDDKNRGWHDKILDSYVVDLKETAMMYQRAMVNAQATAPQREEAPAPKIEEPKAEEPKTEEPKAVEPKVEEPKAEELKTEVPKVEALEAPDKAEALEAPDEIEEIGSAAGDVQADHNIDKDDIELR